MRKYDHVLSYLQKELKYLKKHSDGQAVINQNVISQLHLRKVYDLKVGEDQKCLRILHCIASVRSHTF